MAGQSADLAEAIARYLALDDLGARFTARHQPGRGQDGGAYLVVTAIAHARDTAMGDVMRRLPPLTPPAV